MPVTMKPMGTRFAICDLRFAIGKTNSGGVLQRFGIGQEDFGCLGVEGFAEEVALGGIAF
jgi:hypothetical protein